MSDTPRTDEYADEVAIRFPIFAFARQLERELAEAKAIRDEALTALHRSNDSRVAWRECARELAGFLAMPTIKEARRLNMCRWCLRPAIPLSGNPIVLNYGGEFGHQTCVKPNARQQALARFDELQKSNQ